MSYGLGVLVSARGLLHQSTPLIEVPDVNTPSGRCKPNLEVAGQVRRGSSGGDPGHDRARSNAYLSLRPYTGRTPLLVVRNRCKTNELAGSQHLDRRRPTAE